MPELSQMIENETTGHSTVEAKVVTREKSPKVKYSRPPIEQITSDILDYVKSKTINGRNIEKLGFSCGKLIFGVRDESGQEIRIMALKARKKSLSVDNKSRAMYFFGIEDSNELIRSMPNLPVSTSSRGACSCQVKKPVFLVLDKVTFTENFDKNESNVMITLRRLVDEAIAQKEGSLSQVEESA